MRSTVIAERFGTLRDQVLATEAMGWRDDPDTLLAAILLLDQFSRNLHRDSAQAYAADPLALELCPRRSMRDGSIAIRPSGWSLSICR